jgi:oxygen-independent coproporphyrinogen-3 oxidase
MTSGRIQEMIGKYGGAAPRYTSYPTAMQFHAGITAEDVRMRLERLGRKETISLYVHIPFCHSLCHYCGCHTKIVNKTGIISAYIETLCREIECVASHVLRDVTVSRLHFGGGSPNYAPIADIGKILDTVRRSFTVAPDMSIDMECDPRLLGMEKVRGLAALGVNRISLGVQDFDERVQKAVNRIQPLAQVQDCVAALRKAGITGINFDLIIGLPEQTVESVRRTAAETVRMRPPRIAVFPYAHVPWMKKHQKLLERFRLPGPAERFSMRAAVNAVLCAAGYSRIGMDHYVQPEDGLYLAAREGRLRRNFQGYTDETAGAILGFGVSAISQFADLYAQNTLDARIYRQCTGAGSLPVARGYRLSAQDQVAKEAIMRLMCDFRLDLKECRPSYISEERLIELEKDGIIRRRDDVIEVTRQGRPFVQSVVSCFDAYLCEGRRQGTTRHAKAV